MVIENNPKELAAMKKFHEGNRAEGLKLQEEFASEFREEIVRNAWRFTGLIRNMFQTVCGRC